MLSRWASWAFLLASKTYQIEQTLTALLGGVLNKKYTNPSSDVITVLAGLDEVDRVISEFTSAIDGIIRSGANCEFANI
jgi:hypothetical protein